MKITTHLCAALLAIIFTMNSAFANELLPLDAPVQLNNLEEGVPAPAVTQRKTENKQQTIQTTQNGEQTEVKVTTGIGTYIVKPNQSVGNSLPGDAESSSNQAVQWIIKSWGGSKNTEPNEAPPALSTNPDNSDNP